MVNKTRLNYEFGFLLCSRQLLPFWAVFTNWLRGVSRALSVPGCSQSYKTSLQTTHAMSTLPHPWTELQIQPAAAGTSDKDNMEVYSSLYSVATWLNFFKLNLFQDNIFGVILLFSRTFQETVPGKKWWDFFITYYFVS